MPQQCEGTTREGSRCKKTCQEGKKTCHIHEGDSCAVCMLNMNETNSRRLDCGHVFHSRCLDRWKRRSSTCPMCRTPFDQPMYKVKLTIEPLNFHHESMTSNIQSIIDFFDLDQLNTERFLSTISFSVLNNTDMINILDHIGIIPPGMYPSSLDTERRTEL